MKWINECDLKTNKNGMSRNMTSSNENKKTDFDYFLSGLSILVVIILLILAFPVGLLIAAFLGMLKRLF
jgi:hypothetical protein